LDASLARPQAIIIPLRLDARAMHRQLAQSDAEVPALYRALLRSGLRRASAASAETSTLRTRLGAMASDAERLKALLELVQEDIAAVLALSGASSVSPGMPLKELGLDSLMAVELRNRLSTRAGLKLPSTLAFDYPTAKAMAQLLLEKLEFKTDKSSLMVWGDEQVRKKLRIISIQALRESGLLDRIMAQPNTASHRDKEIDEVSSRIDGAETESLLDLAAELL
jgi:acyl carrier protein